MLHENFGLFFKYIVILKKKVSEVFLTSTKNYHIVKFKCLYKRESTGAIVKVVEFSQKYFLTNI